MWIYVGLYEPSMAKLYIWILDPCKTCDAHFIKEYLQFLDQQFGLTIG